MDKSLKSHWDVAVKQLNEILTSVAMDTVIKELEPLYTDGDFYTFYAENDYVKRTAEHRYAKDIENYLNNISGKKLKLRIVLEKNPKPQEIAPAFKNVGFNNRLNRKYMFSNFIKGNSNDIAYEASLSVAENPGLTQYNPLFIYGGVGLGKTHLCHSIGNHIVSSNSHLCVLYTSTENFTNEFVDGLRNKTIQTFRNKFRDVDCLLIDDIQFLSEKEGTQEELFHTFNTLYNANKQIVITSDLPPKELKSIEERLVSRFGNGLIVTVSLPDFETRMAILKKKAETEKLNVPSDILELIAKSIVSNIRDLEGALIRVTAFADFGNTELTMSIAEHLIRDFLQASGKKEISIEFIINETAKYFGVTPDDIKGKRRTQNLVLPRQVAMYLCRKMATTQSLPIIGKNFSGRDHSTVIYSCDKITYEMDVNLNLKNMLIELENIIACG